MDCGARAAVERSIGFTRVSRIAGFIMVAALDLGAAVWLVVVIGVLAGRFLIGRVERGVAGERRRRWRSIDPDDRGG